MKLTVAHEIASLIRSTQLKEIRSVLEPFSLEERRQIVSKKIHRTSLLLFLAAVKQKDVPVVKYLVEECGASVKDAGPCLSMAAYNKCPQLVKLLFNNGADINSVDRQQKSALYFACVNGDMSLVEYLVKNGAHIDNADIEGKTPLMVSVNFPNICRYLLMNNADPNCVSVCGKTAMMLAAQQEISHYSLYVLHAFIADINFTNEFGENVVFLAAQNGFEQIVDSLESFGAEIATSLSESHQIDSCYASLQNDEIKAQNYWRMSQNILDLSTTSPAFEMDDGPVSAKSSFESILNIFNLKSQSALLYLERRFGSDNPFTLRAIAVAVCHTEDIYDCVRLFAFLLEKLKSTTDSTYFRIIPCINAASTWLLWILKKRGDTEETLQIVQEIFRSYANHVKEFANRFRRLSDKKKTSKSITIDSFFCIILGLIQTIHNFRPEQLSVLNESVEKIQSLNLRGSGYNSLLHFCVKNGYPTNLWKALLAWGQIPTAKMKNVLHLFTTQFIGRSTNK